MTPRERLEQHATQIGITVTDIKTHTAQVKAHTNLLQQAKNDGATDTEMIALATNWRTNE